MYSILKKLLSERNKQKLWLFVIKLIRKKLVDQDNRMPKYAYQGKHVRNLKPLANRFDLLDLMPKNAVVAELGVDKGAFSHEILTRTQPERLHLIDVWNTERYHQGLKNEVQIKFEKQIASKQVILNLGLSTDVVNDFPDNYFDWIYIDTEHSYKVTKAELEKYAVKMKSGGIIAGHDYINGIWVNLTRYGVIEAVAEFCNNYNWELIYITMDYNEPPSFAIRKM
jgi:23S rRNA U2552 (ribose-2'-O)-methylase RlmE/FtsJ